MFYNSKNHGSQFISGCFITNRSLYSHFGHTRHTEGGLRDIRYQFSRSRIWETSSGVGHRCDGSGGGQKIKNNVAGAVNRDSRAHRIYYNTGYKGVYQTFPSPSSKNLMSSLKNDNASSKRL
ncbi:hypothetical protein GCM10009802_28360 [Streptomyces synnematoformans]|uniref:Uncharacterized protein n=1 Tax=Streptomyces synnematoformans TaxID=415721 RepID=A0ABP5K2A3_9ACTN